MLWLMYDSLGVGDGKGQNFSEFNYGYIFWKEKVQIKSEIQYDFYFIYPPNNRFWSLEILSEMVSISGLVKYLTKSLPEYSKEKGVVYLNGIVLW